MTPTQHRTLSYAAGSIEELGSGHGTDYHFTHLRSKKERAGKKLTWKSPGTGWCDTAVVLRSDPGRDLESAGVPQVHDFQKALYPPNNLKADMGMSHALNHLALRNTVSLIWVPGHRGVEPMRYVSQIRLSSIPVEPVCGTNKAVVRDPAKRGAREEHLKLWQPHPEHMFVKPTC